WGEIELAVPDNPAEDTRHLPDPQAERDIADLGERVCRPDCLCPGLHRRAQICNDRQRLLPAPPDIFPMAPASPAPCASACCSARSCSCSGCPATPLLGNTTTWEHHYLGTPLLDLRRRSDMRASSLPRDGWPRR